jgi:hypothetical protein
MSAWPISAFARRTCVLSVRILAAALSLLICLSPVRAQERTGIIQGEVVDASGAGIPGAKVEVSGPALPQPITVTTSSGGAYTFGSLPPGLYTLTVTQQGFATVKRQNVVVQVGRISVQDVKMEVGAVTESVSVSAEAALVDTSSTVISTNVNADLYDRLPKGRGFDTLVALAPGVRPEPKSGGYQVEGSSGSENSFIIDGVEVSSIQNGTLNRQSRIPIEWIAETQVKTSGLDAQFGGATGGVISAITRSGSNQFHGQGSYYLTGDFFDASPRPTLRLNPRDDNFGEYFNNRKDSYTGHNPGFRLGGPIIKNSLWFFLSSYPEFIETSRRVTFLANNQTGEYTSKERQDYTLARLDYQPFAKLRTNFSYIYNPRRINGLLPSRQGTDAFNSPWADQGWRAPQTGYNYQADWTVTNSLLLSVFGGYNYRNYKDYGVPRGTRYRYANGNTALPFTSQIPANALGPAGNLTPNNQQTVQDIFTRNNLNVIGSYLVNAAGQHNIRAGYQLNRLANKPIASTWPDGYIFIYWDRTRSPATSAAVGPFRGTYGYYINRVFATEGDVSSNNHGIFLQDNWRVNRKLTLNLGIRTEREFVPSFSDDPAIPSAAIEFGFGQKLAPRLGFAYDPSGVGKMKIYGSWGFYYDIMKYELPRGSFGGDKWKDYVYTLDTTNIFSIKPSPAPNSANCNCPGRLIEVVDWRIPSNDPNDNLIDKDLKPVRAQNWDFGFDYSLTNTWVSGIRYVHRQIDRTIEDVGILTPAGEQYYITNPGFGYSIDPKRFPAGYPARVTPKAKREYDAVELRLAKRFGSLITDFSYTWSRLYGNYGGLSSSDENGRNSPNVNRYFDEAWMSYDERGKLVYGRLATDRPHTFKAFVSYDKQWGAFGTTRLAPYFFVGSGTPITTEFQVQSVPMYVYGRGDRGRTPILTQTDLAVMHDFGRNWKGMGEGRFFRVEMNISNLFNHGMATNIYSRYDHANDGGIEFLNTADIFKGFDSKALLRTQSLRVDPRYGVASEFLNGRNMRFGLHFFF